MHHADLDQRGALHLEGIVSRRRDFRYRFGHSKN
jgi:hypothetical protein